MCFTGIGASERRIISRARDRDDGGLGIVIFDERLCLIQLSDAGLGA